MPSHRAGSLKQENKKHKGSSSKRSLLRSLGPGKTANPKKVAQVAGSNSSVNSKRTTRSNNFKSCQK